MFVKVANFLMCWIGLIANGYSQAPSATINSSSTASHTKKTVNHSNTDDNTLLWQITGNGLKKPSYLFGTMHILCEGDAILSDNLKKAIKDCDEIYFELDMDNMQEMMGAMKFLRMNDGVKLSDLLTKDEYEKVETYFKNRKFPLPMSMMNRFKPFFLSALISEKLMECEKTNGMEQQIMKENTRYGKETKGLETTEFQAGIFDSIPYEKQAKELLNYIDSIGKYAQSTMEMVEVYRKQDLQGLESLLLKSDPAMADYMDLLVYGRNRNWVQKMGDIMQDKTILFAVGAGHLPGEQGVISLLRKKGYKVTPVNNR